MLDGLSFLPLEQVPQGMAYLREIVPPELEPLVDYFDENYVSTSTAATATRYNIECETTPSSISSIYLE